MLSSLQAPTKFVPLSERSSFAGPQIEKNLLKALIKLDVDMASSSSMCTARVDKQVKRTAHHLLSALPPLVRWVKTDHGPNTSKPTLVKGGWAITLYSGSSAIFWLCNLPCSLRQMTHLCITADTKRLPPRIQRPADLIAPSVMCRPWWTTCSWWYLTSSVATWWS